MVFDRQRPDGIILMRTLLRRYIKTEYSNGKVEIFDPLIVWTLGDGIYEIGLRGHYEIGLLIGYTVGTFSRLKTWFKEFKHFTIYIHYGECEVHNPRERTNERR